MAQLKYCDKHNQVGFLRKPDESTGFAEIVDFLRGSNLRYALTANPPIYDSLVKQFWQSAITTSNADGSLEISATIDTIRYTISEASIRDSLQLDDATGITMLPNADLFEGMGQIGYPTDGTFTFWKNMDLKQTKLNHGKCNSEVVQEGKGDTEKKRGTKGKNVVSAWTFKKRLIDVVKGHYAIEVNNAGRKLILEETPKKSKEQILQEEASLAEAIRLDSLQKEEEAKQIHLDSLLAQRIAEEEKLMSNRSQRKAPYPKRLKEDKDDEAKDDEPTKKSGKRRKQMARKGMHTSVDKNDSEDSDKVGEQEETVTGTETPINPVPVAMKTPSVATYKIIKQGEKGVYQIVREDGTDIVYINFGAMMKSISRDDLTEAILGIVNDRYGMDGPEDKLEKGFWKCLRIMFEEPLSTDSIWSEIGQQKIISWRYYDTCRVHCLNLESMDVYMLSDRKYPLSAEVPMGLTSPELRLTVDHGHYTFLVAIELDYSELMANCKETSKPFKIFDDSPLTGVNTPGSDENRLKLYDLMYNIVNIADTLD
ncbi:hypothetical protein Tco_0183909 [Tanacetum coccineum]